MLELGLVSRPPSQTISSSARSPAPERIRLDLAFDRAGIDGAPDVMATRLRRRRPCRSSRRSRRRRLRPEGEGADIVDERKPARSVLGIERSLCMTEPVPITGPPPSSEPDRFGAIWVTDTE